MDLLIAIGIVAVVIGMFLVSRRITKDELAEKARNKAKYLDLVDSFRKKTKSEKRDD